MTAPRTKRWPPISPTGGAARVGQENTQNELAGSAETKAVKQARERETTCQRSGFGRNVITSSIIIQPDRCSRRSSANQH